MKKIIWDGIIGWDITPRGVERRLQEANGEDITIEANSPGGFVYDGLKIFNLIKNYSGNVTIHIMGLAASMMTYIAMAADRVTAESNVVWMVHNPWGFSVGDHRDMDKSAGVLRGLTGLLSVAYRKRTKKSAEQVTSWMDDETYFFGAEAFDAGFVDEVLDADDDPDVGRDQSIAVAKLAVQACLSKVKDVETGDEAIDRIAAFLKPSGMAPVDKQPTQTREKSMGLQALLAANPDAKAEHDKLIAEATAQGEAKIMGRIKGVSAILGSAEYPASIKALAMKVLAGESTKDALDAAVAAYDGFKEQQASNTAGGETGETGETPAGGPAPESNGVVVDLESEKAAAAAIRASMGRAE